MLRCANATEKPREMSWTDWDAVIDGHCPTVVFLDREVGWAKVRIEAPEARIEGWVRSSAIGPVTTPPAMGGGGLGMRPTRLRCGAERLHVLADGTAWPVAVLTEGATVLRLHTRDDGWEEVLVEGAEWLRAVDGELPVGPDHDCVEIR